MSSRLKRLHNEYREIIHLFGQHPYIIIKKIIGNPPERYQIEYKIKGLVQNGKDILEKNNHLCEIFLPHDFLIHGPICRMITPVFHPNISPYIICTQDHWAASESLVDIILRIGEMISYQNYNIKSPRNGEAAKWAEENIDRFPIDNTDLRFVLKTEAIPMNEPVATKIEILEGPIREKKESSLSACSNCKASGENIHFHECSNGHFVCSDCTVECQICGKLLCVLCALEKCKICGKLTCDKCKIICNTCNQVVCKDHYVKCSSCTYTGCTTCTFVCPKCNKVFCKNHFNEKIQCCVNCDHEDIITSPVGVGETDFSDRLIQEIKESLNTICSNCGADGEKSTLYECSNGHLVCSDCTIECQKCKRVLCVLCTFGICPICKKIICENCKTNCPICNQNICKDHVIKCSSCGSEGCINCFSTCPKCNQSFCKNHFDEQKQCCINCVRTIDTKIIKDKYDDPIKYIQHEITEKKKSHRICARCGYEVREDEHNYCEMCGNVLT